MNGKSLQDFIIELAFGTDEQLRERVEAKERLRDAMANLKRTIAAEIRGNVTSLGRLLRAISSKGDANG